MHIDKPVYCSQINREIFKYLGIPVKPDVHRVFLRAIVLSTTRPLYAAHAQVVECFHDDPAFVDELRELSEAQIFVALSRSPFISEFLDARRKMYEWDRDAYPMYFDSDLPAFKNFPTTSQGDPPTTSLLRSVYSTLYQSAPPTFENLLDLEQRNVLLNAAKTIRPFVSSEEGALTPAFFRRIPNLDHQTDRLLSRLLPSQFTDIYINVFEGYAPTGFPGLSAFEDRRSFPYLDFNVMSSLLTKLGLWRLLADGGPEGLKQFMRFRLHGNFSEFVRAKDRLVYVLGLNKSEKMQASVLANLRGLQISPLKPTADPMNAATEIYRTSEPLVRAAGAIEMPDALTWKGQYLIVTATEVEDRILHTVLTERGFSQPVVVNTDKFSYLERFRSDVGRIFHLRTSAGSGGSSGAFIMGKNAIDRLNPQFVVSVGICFGLQETKQAIGDVVVSDMIRDYEKQRVSKEKPEDRGATRESGSQLLSRARANMLVWQKAPVHVGTIVSGEKLVDDPDFRATLLRFQPTPIAGDMEAWGLSAVCHAAQKQFIMVKGICDWGMNKEKDNQEMAARNACNFMLDALIVG